MYLEMDQASESFSVDLRELFIHVACYASILSCCLRNSEGLLPPYGQSIEYAQSIDRISKLLLSASSTPLESEISSAHVCKYLTGIYLSLLLFRRQISNKKKYMRTVVWEWRSPFSWFHYADPAELISISNDLLSKVLDHVKIDEKVEENSSLNINVYPLYLEKILKIPRIGFQSLLPLGQGRVIPNGNYAAGFPFRFPSFEHLQLQQYKGPKPDGGLLSYISEVRDSIEFDSWAKISHIALVLVSDAYWFLPRLEKTTIWIGTEQAFKYQEELGPIILRNPVLASNQGGRFKKGIAYLYEERVLFFRERGDALVLQQDIPVSELLMVTYSNGLSDIVTVFWHSASQENRSVKFIHLDFHDENVASVWAGFLAVGILPRENDIIQDKLQGHPVPTRSESDSIGKSNMAADLWDNFPLSRVPLSSSPHLLWLSKRENKTSRWLLLPDGHEILVLILHCSDIDTSHAVMDISEDQFYGETYSITPSHNLVECLTRVGGKWNAEIHMDEYIYRIEVPNHMVPAGQNAITGHSEFTAFKEAFDHFLNLFLHPKPGSREQKTNPHNRCLTILAPAPVDVLAEIIRDISTSRPLPSGATSKDSPA